MTLDTEFKDTVFPKHKGNYSTYELGKWAFENQVPFTRNPYDRGKDMTRWLYWNDGWKDAEYWNTEFH